MSPREDSAARPIPATTTSAFSQPQINPALRLLHLGYDHMDLLLDLYGSFDADGYEVETVALTGQKIDLCELFSGRQLEDMSDWCERNLPSAPDLRAAARAEARIEQIKWENEFCAMA